MITRLRLSLRNALGVLSRRGPEAISRLLRRLYCSRFNGALTRLLAGAETIRYGGVTVRVSPAEYLGFNAFIGGDRDNQELARLGELCRDARLFADIGANIGLVGLPVAHAVPSLAVLAVEPDPINHQRLADNLALNPDLAARVHLLSLALGDADGSLDFFPDPDNRGHSRLVSSPRAGSIKVDVRRFDAVCSAHGHRPDVVKIDVEGAELAVLRGMESLFRLHPPRHLWVEVHAFAAADPAAFKHEIRALLLAAGYRLHAASRPPGAPPWEDVASWPDHFTLHARHIGAT